MAGGTEAGGGAGSSRFKSMKRWEISILFLVMVLLLTACNQPVPADAEATASVQPSPLSATETSTPAVTATPTMETTPTQTATATSIPDDGVRCFTDDLPYAMAESSAVVGWKYFADREQLTYRVVYFPSTCSQADIDRDIEKLFFTAYQPDEAILLLVDETDQGYLGKLYSHLITYNFWAMGPEDYPMVLADERPINPNIILFRIDRLNGEGTEGNEILGRMVGLGEHEYIHTVQTKNNPDLAKMIWNDPIYQAYIERFANLNNNSGSYYYLATYSYLSLFQMVDGLYVEGTLERNVTTILKEMGLTLEEYLAQTPMTYDTHVKTLLINVAEQKYYDHLTKDPLNPFLIITRAGLGDLTSYELLTTLYDRYVDDYNQWYYGSDDTQYLPESFDLLFASDE